MLGSRKTRLISKAGILLSLTAPLVYLGCNYKSEKNGDSAAPAVAKGAQPTFAQLSTDVLQAKCFTCHDGGNPKAPDMRTYAAFSARMAEADSRIKDTGETRMPPASSPQLSQAEVAMIDGWIQAGGPENGATAATPTPPTAAGGLVPCPSFAQLKADFLGEKCFKCHNPKADAKKGDLSSYSLFAAKMEMIKSRVMLPATESDHMPPASQEHPHPQLTLEELTTLLDWIEEKGPENGIGQEPSFAPTPTPTPQPVAPTPTPQPTSSPVQLPSFDQLKTNILTGKCFTCHDGLTDIDADDLRDYPSFSTPKHLASIRKRILLAPTDKDHMPPVSEAHPHPQLTQDEVNLILEWIDAGAPEVPPTK